MKTIIVYSSNTGNTEEMAKAINEALVSTGTDVTMVTADNANSADALAADILILGSPAMGAEVLDDPVESFFSSIESSLSGKKVVLVGSYDWGDGQWIRDWEDRVTAAGATLAAPSIMAQLSPDAEALEKCKSISTSILN